METPPPSNATSGPGQAPRSAQPELATHLASAIATDAQKMALMKVNFLLLVSVAAALRAPVGTGSRRKPRQTLPPAAELRGRV